MTSALSADPLAAATLRERLGRYLWVCGLQRDAIEELGRAVAVMIYRYKLHPINLYVWPGNDSGATPKMEVRNGYHLAHWSAAGMNYWAITDAGEGELDGFINGLRAHQAS